MTPQRRLTIQKDLLAWYGHAKRRLPWRKTSNAYAIWVSEVMLQQTQVKTVIPYFLRFMQAWPGIQDLADADLGTVLKAWEGLGYYARARNLHKAAIQVTREMNGIVPDTYDRFKTLPGVGDYIASAVLSIAFGRAHAVVDGNVKRVLSRLFTIDTPVNLASSHNVYKQTAEHLLERDDPGTFNQALMELGALVCTPRNPNCQGCPLASVCLARELDQTGQFPVRIKKKRVPVRQIAAGIVRKDKTLLITRRSLDGLLGGLWEFPGGKVEKGEDPDQACVREILEETGLTVTVDKHLTRVTHAYTHFKIEMDVFYCTYVSGRVRLNGPIDHQWIRAGELDQFPFPRANLKFIPLIEEE